MAKSKVVLSTGERGLLVITVTIVSVCIIMALSIGLVIPDHWKNDNFAGKHSDCQCTIKTAANSTGESFRKLKIKDEAKNNAQKYKRSLSDEHPIISDFPFLISLSEPAYMDSLNERRLACNGIILSKSWILTGSGCVYEKSEWPYLKVRAGSEYWSRDGTLHNVRAIYEAPFEKLVGVNVEPPFKFGKNGTPLPASKKDGNSSWLFATSPGWIKQIKKDVLERHKYKKFVAVKWSSKNCPNCPKALLTHSPSQPHCNDLTTGKILLSERLLGMHSGHLCQKPRFIDDAQPVYHFTPVDKHIREWINYFKQIFIPSGDCVQPNDSMITVYKDHYLNTDKGYISQETALEPDQIILECMNHNSDETIDTHELSKFTNTEHEIPETSDVGYDFDTAYQSD